MDLEEMKKLMTAMREQSIRKLAIKDENGFEIKLERETLSSEPLHYRQHQVEGHPATQSRVERPLEKGDAASSKQEVDYVTSPMVGTVYLSPSPDDPPFVKVGDCVEEDTVICIIEAMKVMNEVKAGKKGKIAAVLVENAHPIDFEAKLFQIS